jgi:hypothetical protein
VQAHSAVYVAAQSGDFATAISNLNKLIDSHACDLQRTHNELAII